MHAAQIAAVGMLSVQKDSTKLSAVISNGMSSFIQGLAREQARLTDKKSEYSYRFVEEEIPACHEPEGIVYPLTCQSDEASAHGERSSHLSHTVVY